MTTSNEKLLSEDRNSGAASTFLEQLHGMHAGIYCMCLPGPAAWTACRIYCMRKVRPSVIAYVTGEGMQERTCTARSGMT